jgi:hypothetical protein
MSIALNPCERGREWLASLCDRFILERSMGTGVPRFRFVLPEWKDVIISRLHADPSSSFNTSTVLKKLGATIRTAKTIRHVHIMETQRRSAEQLLLPSEILHT